jgi:hypothetical protein
MIYGTLAWRSPPVRGKQRRDHRRPPATTSRFTCAYPDCDARSHQVAACGDEFAYADDTGAVPATRLPRSRARIAQKTGPAPDLLLHARQALAHRGDFGGWDLKHRRDVSTDTGSAHCIEQDPPRRNQEGYERSTRLLQRQRRPADAAHLHRALHPAGLTGHHGGREHGMQQAERGGPFGAACGIAKIMVR